MFLKKVKFLLIFSTWLSLGFLTLTSEDMIITFLREHCEGQANILSVLDFFFGWSFFLKFYLSSKKILK